MGKQLGISRSESVAAFGPFATLLGLVYSTILSNIYALGSPQFEAILFAVLACSFYLLESFVDDLEDPFGGSWTVDAALDACDELVDALAVEE